MKFKTTQKAIKEGYNKIISVGYCGLWYLLKYKEPVAYISGNEGWNADIYDVGNGVAICTGYRTKGCCNVQPNYELVNEYNEKAKNIYKTFCGSSQELDELLDELLDEFIGKVLGE